MRKHGLNTWLFRKVNIYIVLGGRGVSGAREVCLRIANNARMLMAREWRKDFENLLFIPVRSHEWNLKSTVCVNANGILVGFCFHRFRWIFGVLSVHGIPSLFTNRRYVSFFLTRARVTDKFFFSSAQLTSKFTPHKTHLSYTTR